MSDAARGLGRRKNQMPTPLEMCRGPEFNADPFGGTSFDSMSFNGVSFDAVLFVVVGLNWVADCPAPFIRPIFHHLL